ncbi:hypothetical protein D3C86_1973260 [compost metagenome]
MPDFRSMAAAGSMVPPERLSTAAPKIPPMPAELLEDRFRLLLLLILALSSTRTLTVRMSPTRWARSSLKKPLAEVR